MISDHETPSQLARAKARDEVVEILQTIEREGLPGPRDVDVAADAIMAIFEAYKGDARR